MDARIRGIVLGVLLIGIAPSFVMAYPSFYRDTLRLREDIIFVLKEMTEPENKIELFAKNRGMNPEGMRLYVTFQSSIYSKSGEVLVVLERRLTFLDDAGLAKGTFRKQLIITFSRAERSGAALLYLIAIKECATCFSYNVFEVPAEEVQRPDWKFSRQAFEIADFIFTLFKRKSF